MTAEPDDEDWTAKFIRNTTNRTVAPVPTLIPQEVPTYLRVPKHTKPDPRKKGTRAQIDQINRRAERREQYAHFNALMFGLRQYLAKLDKQLSPAGETPDDRKRRLNREAQRRWREKHNAEVAALRERVGNLTK